MFSISISQSHFSKYENHRLRAEIKNEDGVVIHLVNGIAEADDDGEYRVIEIWDRVGLRFDQVSGTEDDHYLPRMTLDSSHEPALITDMSVEAFESEVRKIFEVTA